MTVVIAAFAMLAVACGNLTPDSLAYSSEDAVTASETVIRVATPRIRGFERAIDDWEREHPTARVEIVIRTLDDHHRSVLDDNGAGGTFDIVAYEAAFGPDIRERSELFLDLSDFGADRTSHNYLPSRWVEGIANDGQLIGVPLDVDSVALAVRTDLVSEEILDLLEGATSWCDVIAAGDKFSGETETAFLPDGDELFTTMLAQNRLSFIDEDGALLPSQSDALETAWDLTMLAIGEPAIHGTTCEAAEQTNDSIGRIARNLPYGTEEWRGALGADGFAAVLAKYSELRQITVAAPDTSGDWTIIELPGPLGPSSGGLHLGLSADSVNPDLAYDLLSYLSNPIVQQDAFSSGSGPFPSTSVLYDEAAITDYTDEFFGETPIGAIFSSAAERRPNTLAGTNRRIAIEQFTSALNRVETGDETPSVAWSEVLWRIEQFLS